MAGLLGRRIISHEEANAALNEILDEKEPPRNNVWFWIMLYVFVIAGSILLYFA